MVWKHNLEGGAALLEWNGTTHRTTSGRRGKTALMGAIFPHATTVVPSSAPDKGLLSLLL